MPRFDFTKKIPVSIVGLNGYRTRYMGIFRYITNVQPGDALPVVPPIVDNVTAQGTISPFQVLELDVTDEADAFRRIILTVEFPHLKIKEVVFDGQGFGPMYTNINNAQTVISNGYHFALLRDGGWPEGEVTLTPFVIDTTGSENT